MTSNIAPNENVSQRLPIIRCYCGFEILLIPNVKEMSKAIEKHIKEHKRKGKKSNKTQEEAERLRKYLIIQIFDLTAQQEKNKIP